MDTLLLASKLSKRLHAESLAYNILNKLPVLPPPHHPKGEFREIIKEISADNGETCICDRILLRKKYLYDVGIIVPVYNAEQHIAECLDSILGQNTDFTFHVIIINDGSTDGSRKILRKYEERPNVTVIDQENKGHSGARNTGLENCFGKYVTFVDADDRLPVNAIEILMQKAVKGDFDIVGGGYSLFADDKVIQNTLPAQGRLFGFPWGKVYKAKIWSNIQFPPGYWFEDTVCSFIIHRRSSKISTVSDIVYEWRKNTSSISFLSKGKPKILDTLYVTNQLLRDCKDLLLPFDMQFYDILLHQFKVNAVRIYSLANRQVNYANFIWSKDALKIYFKDTQYGSISYKNVELAIKNESYKQFLLSCLFL